MGVAALALVGGCRQCRRAEVQAGRGCPLQLGEFEEFKKVDLKGETLTIFGPWRGEDEALVRSVLDYFTEATGVDDQLFLVRELRAADRHRHAGRQPAQHRHPAAARPDPGSGLQGPADAARRRRPPTGVKDNYGAGQSWVDLGTYKDKDGNAEASSPSPTRPT